MLVTELGEARMKDPKDDLTTALITAEVDGESLTSAELASFFLLLVVAGNETTRNAIAHGLLALTDHPEQMARWQADFDGLAVTAVEEIVRWATPVIHFRRTCTEDSADRRPGAQRRRQGRALVRVRQPRPGRVRRPVHASTSAARRTTTSASAVPGPHFCLGAHLARREITVMFKELFKRMPDIRAVGRAGAAAVELHQRDQAPPGRLDPRVRVLTPASYPRRMRTLRSSSSRSRPSRCWRSTACSDDGGGDIARRRRRERGPGRGRRGDRRGARDPRVLLSRPCTPRASSTTTSGRRPAAPTTRCGGTAASTTRPCPTSTPCTTSSTAPCGSPTRPTCRTPTSR